MFLLLKAYVIADILLYKVEIGVVVATSFELEGFRIWYPWQCSACLVSYIRSIMNKTRRLLSSRRYFRQAYVVKTFLIKLDLLLVLEPLDLISRHIQNDVSFALFLLKIGNEGARVTFKTIFVRRTALQRCCIYQRRHSTVYHGS